MTNRPRGARAGSAWTRCWRWESRSGPSHTIGSLAAFCTVRYVMAMETVPAWIEALRGSRLLSDEQLREAERWAERFSQPRDLANDLVGRGWLTNYQAKQILRGQGSDLMLGP